MSSAFGRSIQILFILIKTLVVGLLLLISGLTISNDASAEPWVSPGDLRIRHDIQLLADAGVITGPVNTWPLTWASISLLTPPDDLTSGEQAAYARVAQAQNLHARIGQLQGFFKASIGADPRRLRTFEDTPRESAEAQAGVDWVGQRFAFKLAGTYAADSEDGQDWRPDGSYGAVTLANWSFSFGYQDQWWGPGRDGSLILSNNARPFPAVRFQRVTSAPFENRWLRWVGPWTFSSFFGQLEQDRTISHAKILGMRFSFRPLPGLEVAASRTAQWGGDGRPQTLRSFYNLLIGNDNRGGDITANNEPGNQLAGFDLRYSRKLLGRNFAGYFQLIGEDEAGGLPSRYLGQFGIESSGDLGALGTYRLNAEYADTTCDFSADQLFNCGYNNSIYLDGYRYRGRVIGHSADNDSQVVSLTGQLVDDEGRQWIASVRRGNLNRGGPPDPRNTLTNTPRKFLSAQLSHTRDYRFGRLKFSAGFERFEDEITGESSNDAQAFIQLRTDL
ncbi:MAG: capsule assembly Wzi family protein [Pseudomonadota bacterium]